MDKEIYVKDQDHSLFGFVIEGGLIKEKSIVFDANKDRVEYRLEDCPIGFVESKKDFDTKQLKLKKVFGERRAKIKKLSDTQQKIYDAIV